MSELDKLIYEKTKGMTPAQREAFINSVSPELVGVVEKAQNRVMSQNPAMLEAQYKAEIANAKSNADRLAIRAKYRRLGLEI